VAAVPDLQRILETTVVWTESHADLERQRTQAAAPEQISEKAQELSDSIARQSEQLRFITDNLRLSDIRPRVEPPPVEEVSNPYDSI
jgi:hypothetical protein